MKTSAAAFILAFSALLCAPASAQTVAVPCIGCTNASVQADIQAQINQQIIRSAVQNGVSQQIQTRAAAQQLQALQMRAQLQNAMLLNANAMQTILLEQQLQILQLNPALVTPQSTKKKQPAKKP